MGSTTDQEMITMAEEELSRLQRQLRIMEDDRMVFSEESRRELEKQKRIIQTLRSEKQKILEDISVANCANQKRKDEKMTKQLDKLLGDYQRHNKWVDNEKHQMKELEVQIKKVNGILLFEELYFAMTSSKEICRTCLNVINSDCVTLNTNKSQMLKLICLDLDLAPTAKPIVCSQCANGLQQSFDFKIACLNNEDYLKTFVHCDTSVKLNLEEVILRGAINDIKHEEESICRLCLRYLGTASFVKLHNIHDDIFLWDMLHKCLPELDFGITNLPLMCYVCIEKLQNHFNFVMVCMDSNEKIKSYVQANGVDSNDTVDLGDVLNFIHHSKSLGVHYLNYVKVETVIESSHCADSEVVKKEDVPGAEVQVKMEESFKKEVEVESSEVSRLTTFPTTKTFSCTECDHKTNRKDSLDLHYRIHLPLSKSELIKCNKCDFRTKWRSSLTQHYLLHIKPANLVTFKCARCPYESKYKKHLRRHCKRHLNRKSYCCEYCWLTTADRSYFKRHNKVKHDNVVTFKDDVFSCNECPFDTEYKSELNLHMKKAHNVAKYVCDCGYTSPKLYHFKQHSLRHKSSDDVSLFGCSTCDFQTKYKNSLKKHEALHEGGKVLLKRGRAKRITCAEKGAE